jgi:hypothetical protein
LTVALLLLLAAGCTTADRITPRDLADFTTDGCSAGFPEGTAERPKLWCDCCVTHDLAYWKGGTAAERDAADLALRECVTDKGKRDTGWLMQTGVWLGGGPYWPTTYRWAYGWPYGRGYAPLTGDEAAAVAAKMPGFEPALAATCGP